MPLRLVLAMTLLATACSGGSTATSDPGPPTAAETPIETPAEPAPTEAPTATPTETPTEVPVPEVTDQDRIDAVIAAMDAAIEAGEAPNGSIAYDLLDTKVNADTDSVTLTICEWTGETVHDTVRDSLWRTSVADDGSVTAEHVTTPVAQGDCTNTHLIETALATATAYDTFWGEVGADPTIWENDPRQELITPTYREISAGSANGFVQDGVYFVGARIEGELTDTVAAEILWRRVADEPQDLIEFAFCRDMDPERGMYRAGVLIDDGRGPDDPGLHSVDAFQLVPQPTSEFGWQIAGRSDLIWSDCLGVEDWPRAASEWRPSDLPFEVLPS